MGVHLVPTYDISSRFVWNNYDKIAWIRHRISVTKQTVSKVQVCVVYIICNHAHFYMQKKFKMAIWQCLNRSRVSNTERCVIAEMTAQFSPYMGALKIFGTPCVCPRLLFPKFSMGFCSNSPYECAYKIQSPRLYPILTPEIIGGTQKFEQSLDMPTLPLLKKILMGFSSDASYKCRPTCQIRNP